MDAVKFLEELRRMCDNNRECNDCPAFAEGACSCKLEHIPVNYEDFVFDDLVSFVEKWSAEHPKKTRLQDFLEKYPNAVLTLGEKKVPAVSPGVLGYCKCSCCDCPQGNKDLSACWDLPLED